MTFIKTFFTCLSGWAAMFAIVGTWAYYAERDWRIGVAGVVAIVVGSSFFVAYDAWKWHHRRSPHE